MRDIGTVEPGTTIYLPFETFASSTGAPITLTGLATSDILVYKDGGTTQRASSSGYTLLDTDGIDFDGLTGIHGVSIDLSDNTTADFWQAGSRYFVVIGDVTVDSQTMRFLAGSFRIGYPAAFLNTFIASLTNQTSFTLNVGPAEDDALNGMWAIIHDAASAVQKAWVLVSDYTGASKTVTLAAGATFTVAAKDNIAIMFPAPLQPTVLGRTADVDASGGVEVGSFQNNAITAAAIATDAIDADAMADGAITAATFAAGAIDATAIAADAIGSSELAATAVAEIAAAILTTPANLLATDASGQVTVGAIANNAVTAAAIANGAIDAATFAAGAIDATAIAADAIGSSELAAGAVTEIATGVAAAILATPANLLVTDASGRALADVDAINGDPDGATNLDRSTRAIVLGTVDAGSSTTSIVTSSLDPAAAVADQFKGRIVIFDKDTTTANLRGQATDITASSNVGVLTVTALTTAPAAGDTFSIT